MSAATSELYSPPSSVSLMFVLPVHTLVSCISRVTTHKATGATPHARYHPKPPMALERDAGHFPCIIVARSGAVSTLPSRPYQLPCGQRHTLWSNSPCSSRAMFHGRLFVGGVVVRSEQCCARCGSVPPKTETSYTLIDHGWRLTVAAETESRQKVELWCPSCWTAHHEKARQAPPSRRAWRR